MADLKTKYGEWAVITGASDGIGQAFAKHLATHKLNLVLVARRKLNLERLARVLMEEQGIQVVVIEADLSDMSDVMKVISATQELDVGLYVGAAGFGTSGELQQANVTSELNMLDVNCRAVLAHTHHFLQYFKARSRGGIVLLSSIVAFQGVPQSAHYSATKAYIQSLAEGIYSEAKDHNVDVLAVAPGPVKSGFSVRANLMMGGADTPASVAVGAMQSLGNNRTIRTGFFGKLLGYSLSLLPRWGRILVMTQVMAGMTKHQKQEDTANGVL